MPPALTVTLALNQVGAVNFPVTLPPVLAGTVSDSSGVSAVYVRMGKPSGQTSWTTLSLNGSSWSFAPTVTGPGLHSLTLEARDGAGNVTSYGPHALNVKANLLYLPLIMKNAP